LYFKLLTALPSAVTSTFETNLSTSNTLVATQLPMFVNVIPLTEIAEVPALTFNLDTSYRLPAS
jgi:hypothetical protein